MEFVQLRSFDNYIEANIVLNMLRHYNINCHLKDENIITIDPFLSPAIGGMKLMVHHAHVERLYIMLAHEPFPPAQLLVAIIGVVIGMAGRRERVEAETVVLAVGSAAALHLRERAPAGDDRAVVE